MDSSQPDLIQLERRFSGFRETAFLWDGVLEGLEMFRTIKQSVTGIPKVESNFSVRLGKLVEQFVLFEIKQDLSIQILKSNIQVFQGLRTIGELDILLRQISQPIHLEVVYKFYLYDHSISEELNRWVGPNRNDSLVQKIQKLTTKQLPLLYREETKEILDEVNMALDEFRQQVYFKAQLFIPFQLLNSSFPIINNECIEGFYLRPKELSLFPNYEFHIPSKLDWLVQPHDDVRWMSVHEFEIEVTNFLNVSKSPLCWMKSQEGKLAKFFLVWWK